MIRASFVAASALLIVTPALAQPSAPAAGNACATEALNEYTKRNLALSSHAVPVKSVEATIAQRRLQEQFCLELSRCLVGEPSNRSLTVPYAIAFSSCLRDEAFEQ
jgi:hypothetical protein